MAGRKIKDENVLMQRVIKMLPKGIPAEAIQSVECDPYSGDGGSYWVYLADGFICTEMECHTIHEDTLSELKTMLSSVEIWIDDPALDDHKGYGSTSASEMVESLRDEKSENRRTNNMKKVYMYDEGRYHGETTSATVAMSWHREGKDVVVWEYPNHTVIKGTPKKTITEKHDDYCRSIASDIDDYTDGLVYECPECGEIITVPTDWSGEKYKCPGCGTVLDGDDLEQKCIGDYFNDCYDIEYSIGGDKQFRAVRLMIAFGGPNIYVNTNTGNVELYWWGERGSWSLSSDAIDAINDYFEELYECL